MATDAELIDLGRLALEARRSRQDYHRAWPPGVSGTQARLDAEHAESARDALADRIIESERYHVGG